MNPMFLAFSLCLLWTTVAFVLLVLGPVFMPNLLPENLKNELLGYAAAALAVWNLVRWWSMRSFRKQQQMMDEDYRQRTDPLGSTGSEPKPIAHPEFKFDDESNRK